VEPLVNPRRAQVRWWPGRFDLLETLEQPSMEIDPTIRRLQPHTLRRNPDLARSLAGLNVPAWDLLGYQAIAEDVYGRVRIVALLPYSPFEGNDPWVYALDGPRDSLHRNPPRDEGTTNQSASLCLYFSGDPDERCWSAEYGLLELFDLARRHLAAEHIWRTTKKWPFEDAAHGLAARPTHSRPELRVEPLRKVGA
jgi:hypothetical protein